MCAGSSGVGHKPKAERKIIGVASRRIRGAHPARTVAVPLAKACPLAFSALQRLDRELAALPGLASRVRLVTVSFDPDRDTPARMHDFRRHFAPAGDWRFLTAPDVQRIEPVIGDFGQDVLRSAGDSRVVEHVLKVFLVDSDGNVRNVYSAGFLDAEILRNDAATVLGLAPASWSGEPEAR